MQQVRREREPVQQRGGFQLPTEKTPPRSDIQDLTILIYGAPKIGKSTFCAQAESTLFLATEPGLNHLEAFQAPVHSWEDLRGAVLALERGGHNFKTVVLDTVDNAYLMCTQHICRENKVQHESEMEWGRGSALIQREFQEVLTRLAQLPMGLILVSHSLEKEIKPKGGRPYSHITPTLPEKPRKIALGIVDCILYAEIEVDENTGKERRVLRTKGTSVYEAGDRTGRLPETLPLSYEAFLKAFRAGAPASSTKTPPPEHVARLRALAIHHGWKGSQGRELLADFGWESLDDVPAESEHAVGRAIVKGYRAWSNDKYLAEHPAQPKEEDWLTISREAGWHDAEALRRIRSFTGNPDALSMVLEGGPEGSGPKPAAA